MGVDGQGRALCFPLLVPIRSSKELWVPLLRRDTNLDPMLLSQLEKDKLPQHLAIVMDGNGRWAQRRNLPRNAGHRAGVQVVYEVVATCGLLGIPALRLFALCTENLERARIELVVLIRILRYYLR